jgi:pimeloyl-ACP methyl ester carboxylesterase
VQELEVDTPIVYDLAEPVRTRGRLDAAKQAALGLGIAIGQDALDLPEQVCLIPGFGEGVSVELPAQVLVRWPMPLMQGEDHPQRVVDAFDGIEVGLQRAAIVHGVADQSAPIDLCSRHTAKLMPDAIYKEYPTAGHGLYVTHAGELNNDILNFIKR